MITVSIVSHGHCLIIEPLLIQLSNFLEVEKIILTININSNIDYSHIKKIVIIKNDYPKGFGENHNNAFKLCKSEFFLVLNPDIDLLNINFNDLINNMIEYDLALATPLIIDNNNEISDNARKDITFSEIIIGSTNRAKKLKLSILKASTKILYPDWICGCFMLFKKSSFDSINGFDTSFYMYCEDQDICKRMRLARYKIGYIYDQCIKHDSARNSHKSFKFLIWHITSLLRYYFKSYQ